ncbi:hypothetical protein SAMN04489867_0808 [Pedococcus dokdonensis]|uniref:Uncharacterized protein n=1 Tax=Pedococcus dokdonensis TaxID=443156 RepID=A0A1H0N417_9MICO|nr:hypothetical protein [Pedococcus dokdonensis]SDO87120.1 hypothetical protein SAMN04489867_0808 [Pedococcus dokdonensis]
MTNTNDQTVETRMADLTAACAAVVAYQRGDREGTTKAMNAITTGRSGETLLALGVLLADQVARASGLPWDTVMSGVMSALLDPDERAFVGLGVQFVTHDSDEA